MTTRGRKALRFLVIDRSEDTAAMIRGLLRGRLDATSETDWVADAQQALQLIDRQEYDIWLIDHQFDAAENGALLEAVVSAGFPPLVLLDGHRNCAVEQEVVAAGAASFIWKEELSAPLLQSALRHALDVRDRVRLERRLQLGQRFETVGRLAGGIAHEFNNILTAIVGFGSLLAERVAGDDASASQIREILGGADRATTLTRDLLAFSRRQVMRPTKVDLRDVVEHLSRMLQGVLGPRVALRVRCAESVPDIHADRAQLDQAVTTLAIRARDAMPEGGELTLEVDTVTIDSEYCDAHIAVSPGEYVRLSVTDTGTGIPRDILPHVFEPFFSGRELPNSGLALSMVYGIVKQSGGNIWAYSEAGHGTTFKLYFPVFTAAPGAEPARAEQHEETLRGTETILVVDDTDIVRNLTRDVLARAGYNVLEAAGADEAMQVANRTQASIDLLVTDVVMPGRNGVELADRIRTATDLPVLYISGYTDLGIVRDGLLAGGAEFLQKPFTPEDLLRKVRAVLEAA